MTNIVKQKRSTTPGAIPTTAQIDVGELALNLPDRKIFTSDGTSVFELGALTPPAGANTNIQFNDAGVFGGTADFTFDKVSKDMAVTGNATSGNVITGNVSASGIVTATRLVSNIATGTAPIVVNSTTRVANLNVSYSNVTDFSVVGAQTTGTFYPTLISGSTSANYALGVNSAVSFNAATGAWNSTLLGGTLTTAAQPNITSVGTLVTLTVTGNVDAGNLTTGGQVVATGNVVSSANINGVNVNASGAVVATGNITGANLLTGGIVQATGNVIGGNLVTNGVAQVTGNVIGGNITTGGQVVATGNVVSSANVNAVNFNASGAVIATGNVSGGNVTTAGNMVATGNVTGGNLLTAGLVQATGNVIGGNLVTNGVAQVTGNVIGGNLTTAGQVVATGNITSSANISGGNILTGGIVQATGNVSGGNVTTGGQVVATGNVTGSNINTAGEVVATGNVSGGNINTAGNVVAAGNIQANTGFISNSLTTRTGPLTLEATSTSNIELKTGTGNVYLSTQTNITNVKDPVNAQDAATKFYVDSVAQGLKPKAAAQVCAGSNINLASAPATIDGITPASGDRVLVKGQTNSAENGIYTYNGSGSAMTRTTDADTAAELPEGTFIFVETGTSFGATGHVLTSVVTTLGTDPVIFTQFAAAASYLAGVGLSLAGVTFNLTDTAVAAGSYGNATHTPTFTVDQQGRLTAASNVEITANAEKLTGTILNSTVVTSSLTSVGTLTSLTVTGLTTSGNIAATGNVTAPTLISNVATGTPPLTVTSTTLVPNLYVATSDVSMKANVTAQTTGNFYLNFGSATSGNLALGANAAFIANINTGTLFATKFSGQLVAPPSNTHVLFNDADVIGADAGFTYDKSTKAITMNPAANTNVVFNGATGGNFGQMDKVIIDCGTF